MTEDKTPRPQPATSQGPVLLDARLMPYRSLSRRGFTILMALFGGLSFVAGVVFVSLGAWPVMGFFGLDVLLLWYALRTNFGAANVSEQITVTPSEVTIRRFVHDRETTKTVLNSAWVHVVTDQDDEDGMLHLGLRSHGKSYTLGAFLDPASRESFSKALRAALSSARHSIC